MVGFGYFALPTVPDFAVRIRRVDLGCPAPACSDRVREEVTSASERPVAPRL